MKIDAHIHFTPPSLADCLQQYSEREPLWGLMIAPQNGKRSIQGWATAERMIEDMDKAGLERVIIQGAYRQSMDGCVEENDKILGLIQRYPDRVSGFAMLYPSETEKSIEELKRCLDGGMSGVGELNPYAQDFQVHDAAFREVAEACIQLDIPVCFHTNEEIGHVYPGKGTVPLRHFYHLAVLYPELKIILAHWGGGLFFYEIMPEVKKVLKNVWYDMAASPLLFPTQKILGLAMQCIDHKKILFGSDYPLMIYPSKMKEPEFEMFMTEIASAELSDDAYNDIMGNNVARLLGWVNDHENENDFHDRSTVKNLAQIDLINADGISGNMSVRFVAESNPATRMVFEKYDIAWSDSPVPFWETIRQAAAARGWNARDLQHILDELNETLS